MSGPVQISIAELTKLTKNVRGISQSLQLNTVTESYIQILPRPYTYFPTNSSILPSQSTLHTAHFVSVTAPVQWLALGWNSRNRLNIHGMVEQSISSTKLLDQLCVSISFLCYRKLFPWGKKWPEREALHSHPLVPGLAVSKYIFILPNYAVINCTETNLLYWRRRHIKC